jgi:hypothetical protein
VQRRRAEREEEVTEENFIERSFTIYDISKKIARIIKSKRMR